MQQLDRITRAMGLKEGFFYELYIDEYIIEGSSDWRRIGPLLLRCANLNKMGAFRRIARHIMDNLMYAPLLFDMAEELFRTGQQEVSAVIYEIVAESERFQHSERLALCQYRIFTISLGDDQDKNLWAANRFEPYVERLDEIDQLDALKELINNYRSLQSWDKVDELARKMGDKARIQYDLKNHPQRKSRESPKVPGRPLFFYIAYSDLLRGNVCDELGDYEQALIYKYAYGDLSWVKEHGIEVEHWKSLFMEWSEANLYITKLLSGDSTVIESYVTYIDKQKEEQVTGLLYILKAANKFKLDVGETLEHFSLVIQENVKELTEGNYSRNLAFDRQANLMYELGYYFLSRGEFDKGFVFLFKSVEFYQRINNEKYILECVTLFERFRNVAHQNIQVEYQTLLFGGRSYEETNNHISNCS